MNLRRFYLVEVLTGIAITSGHFFRNMGRWIRGQKGAVTYQWPEERRPLATRLRSLHRLVRRADGSGTTFIFTNYLSKVNAEWKSRVGEGIAVNWPTGAGGKGRW